jgi:hypothetical protein
MLFGPRRKGHDQPILSAASTKIQTRRTATLMHHLR